MGKHVTKYRKCFVFIILLFFADSLFSQENIQKLNVIVFINRNRIRLDSLVNNLSKQSGIDFSYNSKKINPASIVIIKKQQQTLSGWLQVLQRQALISYTFLGDHIILKENLSPDKKPVAEKSGNAVSKNPKMKQGKKIIHVIAPDTISFKKDIEDSITDKTIKHFSHENFIEPVHDSISSEIIKQDDPGKNPVEKNETRGNNQIAKKNREANELVAKKIISAGLNISKPGSFSKGETSSAFGIGIDFKLEKLFSKKLSGTFGAGYNYFIGKYNYTKYVGDTANFATGKNFANIPVLAGIKYNLLKNFYVAAEAGMILKGSNNTGSHFGISPSSGYVFPFPISRVDISIRMTYVKAGFGIPESTSLQNGGYSFWSLIIAYLF